MKHKKFWKFTGAYLFRIVTLLIAVSIIAFFLVTISPIDPIQQYVEGIPGVTQEQRDSIAEYWGLNDPPVERYFRWGSSLLHGDFGTSIIYRRPVIDIIAEKFITTLALMLVSWTMAGLIGFFLGCMMGIYKERWIDQVLKRICLTLCSIPTFWIGIVFLMFFSVMLGWFPLGMAVPAGVPSEEVTIWQKLHHLILPALTLSLLSFANIALHTREKLIDALGSDYVLFAKARGDSPMRCLCRHGLRNTMMPAITMQFASFSELFGGSVLAENVFSYPGLGAATSAAALQSDVPLLLGITLFSTLFVFTGNMLANILYGIIDPQIREG
jgi:peptide/nickel transport system permease protein